MLPCRGTGFIAGWGSKTHVLHNIAKRERERESKQIHCMTLINFARRQEIEKIFPAKMWGGGKLPSSVEEAEEVRGKVL